MLNGLPPSPATRIRLWWAVLLFALLFLTGAARTDAALVDSWRAADLSSLDNGDAVDSWTSANGRTLTASSTYRPNFYGNVTAAGGPVVRFNNDWLSRSDNSPVAGLSHFSIALVFRADAPGADGTQWYNNSGIVDAEQSGVTADWGTVIDSAGEFGWGIGSPDQTLYSSGGPSLVDGNFHVVVCAWGDGEQEIVVDNAWNQTLSGASASPRNDAGLSFGGIHTGEGDSARRFQGDVVEVRFYDTRLTGEEMTNVVNELRDLHITPGTPSIYSFTADPNQILIDSPVTLAWDTTNADALAIQPGVGVVGGASGSVVVYPRTNTTYTLIASNDVGVLTRDANVLVDQGIPVATNQSLSTFQNQATNIVLTGSDPQGAALTYHIVTPPAHGSLSGSSPTVSYTPALNYFGNDQFTFKVNDGEFDSPPATVTIQIKQPPAAPSDIAISTTNISSGTHPGNFIASFSATDLNAGDSHTFTLVPGYGDNARFTVSGALLSAGDTFVGFVDETFTIRVRATDSTGLWTEKTFNLGVTTNAESVVINEVHYNPEDNTVLEEFIELYNPTSSDVDASFWQVKGAVDLTLPNPSIIPAGGFLVLAQDPATILARYGVPAVGPWDGGLSSDGETIRLEDATGNKVDKVDYKPEFPWPVAADGEGASIELVNPSLDNELGSSWRSSFAQLPLSELTYVPLQSGGWSWRPGDTEASNPIDDWRKLDFVEDGSWIHNVQLPIGYGTVNGVTLNTTISGMQNNYTCLFLRKEFIISPGEVPSGLLIRSTSDDGFVMWINGKEVERRRFSGVPAIGLTAVNQDSEGAYETTTVLDAADDLVPGTNVIAVQLINTRIDSSDIGFDVEVSRFASAGSDPTPTPGKQNVTFAMNAAPNIRQVQHTPPSPTSTNEIVITAKVTDPEGVASVELQYQLVSPGNYIPAYLPLSHSQLLSTPDAPHSPNPAYFDDANWTSLPMVDDGTGGDALAADNVFSVTLPAQANRVLVRYRIIVTDALGLSRRAPFEDDPSLNFTCYVYDGVPGYEGTSSADLQTLPVYTLIARAQDVNECIAYNGAYQIPQYSGSLANPARYVFNWPGTLVYDGEVYDHIHYRLRGANGRYQPGKRNWRFKMNRGHYLVARDQFGKKFSRKWTHLTTGKGSNNRLGLTFGFNEVMNYFLWNKVGVPAPHTFFFHFRVVDGSDEAPSQYSGDFWGLNWAQEDYDGRFLDSHGLEKGNLYKLINAPFSFDLAEDMVGQRRYQGPFAVTNGTDGAAIQNSLLAYQTTDWIRSHVNYAAWYHYHGICEAIRHYDFWPSANKNAAWYFEPPYDASNDFNGRFWTFPWDTDCTWGATWNNGQDLVYNGIFNAGSHPELELEYRNTLRELRDLLFQPDQINPLLDAFAARIAPFVPADLARWSNAPASGGNYVSMVAASGFSTPALTGGLAGQVADMKEFMFTGGTHSWWIDGYAVPTGGWITRLDRLTRDPSIPTTPVIYYVGQSNFPMNSLTFECLPYSDLQGANTFAAMQWRLAEVRNTNEPPVDPRGVPPMEWDAIWESGTLTTWTNRITIPGLVVETNHVYRVRVRHQDNTGRWSHWSDPVQFSVSAVDLVSVLRENLRFSEIMYHPAALSPYDDEDLEFLELQNIGATPLHLGGLTFTEGINFTFSNGTTLGPGEHFLLGRNAAALQARYPGIVVNGIYTGKLDNGGETLRLSTPTGITILEVTYKDSSPWPVTADGMGWSLVLDDPVAGTYRASSALGGSPDATDPASTIAPIVITELLTHTDLPQVDTIELHNPTTAPVDVGGWFLTDDKDVPKKFRIPDGTVIGAGGYLTFDQSQYDTNGLDFNLSSLGDEVYLFSGDAATNLTGYVHGVPFGASQNGVSFGRCVNSMGLEDFVAMSTLTLGTNNSPPRVGPVIVSEIMFQPPLSGTNENYNGEFIELQNITATNVPLYATAFPTNTWKLDNAVDYAFPTNVLLPPGAVLLVVGFDPQADATARDTFLSTHDGATNTSLYGPWSGHLDNSGESIELKLPDTPELDGFVPYVMVEKISYRPMAPWPSAAGNGLSLQRLDPAAYGNEPINWQAAAPTPGVSVPMPPPAMMLRVRLDPADSHPVLWFEAEANRSYALEYSGQLASQSWSTMTNIVAASTNRLVIIKDALAPTTRFYRVSTPVSP